MLSLWYTILTFETINYFKYFYIYEGEQNKHNIHYLDFVMDGIEWVWKDKIVK